MGMKVPKVSVEEYLQLLTDSGCHASPSHALINQDIRDGMVYFRDTVSISLFKELLIASETGIPPVKEFYRKIKSNKKYEKALGFITLEMLMDNIKNLTGPESSGWYRGQCPSCIIKEAGEVGHTKNSFCFNIDDGRIVCHKGCHISNIAAALGGDV
tara:strand:+ start:14150 stop:14620 length:471 start_codon:yes stop_codon:yes gene_type:complete